MKELGAADTARESAHPRDSRAPAPSRTQFVDRVGRDLVDQGKLDEAAAHYRSALAREPDDAILTNSLGRVLMSLDKIDDAIGQFIRAVALKPDFARAYLNLGNALTCRGHFRTAIAALKKSLALKPDYLDARAQLAYFKAHVCDWSDDGLEPPRIVATFRRQLRPMLPFILLMLPSTPADQLACARQVAERAAARAIPRYSHCPRASKGKIRLGYFSADFREHPMGRLMVEMIERHDRSRFEVVGYSFGPDDGSALRNRLRAAFDVFVDLRVLDNAQATEQIRANHTDILIDQTGYTGYSRTNLLAARPAPIQVNFPGYPGTLGADVVDYIIADSFVAPMEQQPFYSERIVHLPHFYLPHDTRRTLAKKTPTRAECGLPEKGVVFCCFNNTYKITPEFFEVWMRLLREVPSSVLWLLEANSFVRENLQREATLRGVASDRLIFAPMLSYHDHLVRYRLADLFLDTLPYCAHTTASDALWLGLPVLTCAGSTFAGRVGASLVRAAGLGELATTSLEEYGELAFRLARAPDLLVGLRERLLANRSEQPFFDMARFTRDVETAYETMSDIWCRGELPRQFAVEATTSS